MTKSQSAESLLTPRRIMDPFKIVLDKLDEESDLSLEHSRLVLKEFSSGLGESEKQRLADIRHLLDQIEVDRIKATLDRIEGVAERNEASASHIAKLLGKITRCMEDQEVLDEQARKCLCDNLWDLYG